MKKKSKESEKTNEKAVRKDCNKKNQETDVKNKSKEPEKRNEKYGKIDSDKKKENTEQERNSIDNEKQNEKDGKDNEKQNEKDGKTDCDKKTENTDEPKRNSKETEIRSEKDMKEHEKEDKDKKKENSEVKKKCNASEIRNEETNYDEKTDSEEMEQLTTVEQTSSNESNEKDNENRLKSQTRTENENMILTNKTIENNTEHGSDNDIQNIAHNEGNNMAEIIGKENEIMAESHDMNAEVSKEVQLESDMETIIAIANIPGLEKNQEEGTVDKNINFCNEDKEKGENMKKITMKEYQARKLKINNNNLSVDTIMAGMTKTHESMKVVTSPIVNIAEQDTTSICIDESETEDSVNEAVEELIDEIETEDGTNEAYKDCRNESGAKQSKKTKKRNRMIAYLKSSQDRRISLNIGGTKFETSEATLKQDPHSMFSLLFDDESPNRNNYFIDRDPAHFRIILNYLRWGCSLPTEAILPNETRYLLEIQEECKFYNIKGLKKIVKERLRRLSGLEY